MTWIQTLDGQAFDLEEPDYKVITPETLAIVLSKKCRFGGHCDGFYSVAQHSVFVCDIVEREDLRLAALLHDAHEAFSGFGDVLMPAKFLNAAVQEFLYLHERKIDTVIGKRFGVDPNLFYHSMVKKADLTALATEQRDVMKLPPQIWDLVSMPPPSPLKVRPWGMALAADKFLDRLYRLTM